MFPRSTQSSSQNRAGDLYLPDFNSTYFSYNDFGTYSQTWQLTSDSNDWTIDQEICQSNGTVLAEPSSPPNGSTGNFSRSGKTVGPTVTTVATIE